MSVGLLSPIDLSFIWLSNILNMGILDEGYSRNVPDEDYYRNVPDEGYYRNSI
jgi:hypothetical protein